MHKLIAIFNPFFRSFQDYLRFGVEDVHYKLVHVCLFDHLLGFSSRFQGIFKQTHQKPFQIRISRRAFISRSFCFSPIFILISFYFFLLKQKDNSFDHSFLFCQLQLQFRHFYSEPHSERVTNVFTRRRHLIDMMLFFK